MLIRLLIFTLICSFSQWVQPVSAAEAATFLENYLRSFRSPENDLIIALAKTHMSLKCGRMTQDDIQSIINLINNTFGRDKLPEAITVLIDPLATHTTPELYEIIIRVIYELNLNKQYNNRCTALLLDQLQHKWIDLSKLRKINEKKLLPEHIKDLAQQIIEALSAKQTKDKALQLVCSIKQIDNNLLLNNILIPELELYSEQLAAFVVNPETNGAELIARNIAQSPAGKYCLPYVIKEEMHYKKLYAKTIITLNAELNNLLRAQQNNLPIAMKDYLKIATIYHHAIVFIREIFSYFDNLNGYITEEEAYDVIIMMVRFYNHFDNPAITHSDNPVLTDLISMLKKIDEHVEYVICGIIKSVSIDRLASMDFATVEQNSHDCFSLRYTLYRLLKNYKAHTDARLSLTIKIKKTGFVERILNDILSSLPESMNPSDLSMLLLKGLEELLLSYNIYDNQTINFDTKSIQNNYRAQIYINQLLSQQEQCEKVMLLAHTLEQLLRRYDLEVSKNSLINIKKQYEFIKHQLRDAPARNNRIKHESLHSLVPKTLAAWAKTQEPCAQVIQNLEDHAGKTKQELSLFTDESLMRAGLISSSEKEHMAIMQQHALELLQRSEGQCRSIINESCNDEITRIALRMLVNEEKKQRILIDQAYNTQTPNITLVGQITRAQALCEKNYAKLVAQEHQLFTELCARRLKEENQVMDKQQKQLEALKELEQQEHTARHDIEQKAQNALRYVERQEQRALISTLHLTQQRVMHEAHVLKTQQEQFFRYQEAFAAEKRKHTDEIAQTSASLRQERINLEEEQRKLRQELEDLRLEKNRLSAPSPDRSNNELETQYIHIMGLKRKIDDIIEELNDKQSQLILHRLKSRLKNVYNVSISTIELASMSIQAPQLRELLSRSNLYELDFDTVDLDGIILDNEQLDNRCKNDNRAAYIEHLIPHKKEKLVINFNNILKAKITSLTNDQLLPYLTASDLARILHPVNIEELIKLNLSLVNMHAIVDQSIRTIEQHAIIPRIQISPLRSELP